MLSKCILHWRRGIQDMNLKLCEKRFLVINSPFFLHVPAFVLDCVHAVQWGGGGGDRNPSF